MKNADQLREDYQRMRRQLEEQEDDVRQFQQKGRQVLEDSSTELRYALQNFALDGEPLHQAQRELNEFEGDYLEILKQKRKEILNAQEELEQQYRYDRQQIEKNKK